MFVIKNFLLTVMALGLAFTAKAQEQTLQKDEIPVEIKDFIEQHYPSVEVANAVINNDGEKVACVIELSGGVALEFDENKEIVSIDGDSPLPESVISPNLLEYVTAQHPGQSITGWKLENNQQILKLDDETEVVFDKDGNFLRKDI